MLTKKEIRLAVIKGLAEKRNNKLKPGWTRPMADKDIEAILVDEYVWYFNTKYRLPLWLLDKRKW